MIAVSPALTVFATGLAGAVVSVVATIGSLASDVFPAGSVAFAVTLPAGIATVGVIVALPFSSAVASPILLPSLSNNSTLEPGSALTSTGVLVPALSVRSVATTGLAGVLGSFTVTLTGTSSLDPSGYVTTTVASFSPGVVVSTGVLNSTVVPLGRSSTLPIESLADGLSPGLTV